MSVNLVFAHNRSGLKKIIPKLLFYGKQVWNVDLQYYINEKYKTIKIYYGLLT